MLSYRTSLIALLWSLLFSLTQNSEALATNSTPQVLLIQNSGWMEPLYTDPRSDFKPLLKAFVTATTDGSPYTIATFNQKGQIPQAESPFVLYRGASKDAAGALDRLSLPKRPDGKFADADFHGAFEAAVQELLAGNQGVIWMVTNNKNSPSNSAAVRENTRSFYDLLRTSPYVTRIFAIPIRMPAKGQFFSETGFIIYGIAYGDAAAEHLDELTQAPAVRALFVDPPAKLKPLTTAPVSFAPTELVTEGVEVRVREGRLIVSGLQPNRANEVAINGVLRSNYYPQTIREARLSIAVSEAERASGFSAKIEPETIKGLGPLGEAPVRITLTLPAISQASMGERARLANSQMSIALSDVRLELSDGFATKMQGLFGLDQLPELFFDHRAVTTASTVLPVTAEVRFSRAPLYRLAATLAALLAAAGLASYFLRRSRRYLVTVEGRTVAVVLRAFRSVELRSLDHKRALLRVTGTVIGKPRLTTLQS